MSVVIKLENVSKQYRLGQIGTNTLKGDLQRWWYSLRGLPDPTLPISQENVINSGDRRSRKAGFRHFVPQPATGDREEYIWALKDISFEVEQGEVLGIIGKNGAGKSTLLKLLSRVTAPTNGTLKVKGRVASLLEVGTGFHPELTGRENIYLNGAILGMTKAEIRGKFDEIVDFSGCELYIDTPVKRYSSGMYVRLAFAVAAHLEPEILIVDEVLAVGDAEFQKKAIGKMQDVSTKEGRTVLFVSHNLLSIQRLCNKSILLDKGNIISSGSTDKVVSQYISEKLSLVSEVKYDQLDQKNKEIEVISAICTDSENNIKNTFHATEDIYLKFAYRTNRGNLKFIHGLNIYNEQEINVFNSHDTTSDIRRLRITAKQTLHVQCIIPRNFLNEGIYSVAFALFSPEPFFVYNHQLEILRFRVIDLVDGKSARGEYVGSFPGVVRPILEWSIIG
ncbi:MAG: ABC transporter ATP-binding protein [Bacteroidales bacterium]|jgi:lipopolysaccharide transport system ATP-binding protein